MTRETLLALAERKTDLPSSYEEIFKQALDKRGRPVKSLRARAACLVEGEG